MSEESAWYKRWFNEDYLATYGHRDAREAEAQVAGLLRLTHFPDRPLRILDLGCGAGRHVIAFCKRGHHVTGIDASAPMVKAAGERLDAAGLHAALYERDYRSLSDLGQFDLITCFFTSFGYFDSDREDLDLLVSVRHALELAGLFVLDYLHPDEVRRSLVPSQELQVGEERVHIEKSIKQGRIIKRMDFPGRSYEERVRLYDRQQLEAILEQAELTVEGVFDDFSGTPWSEEGNRQIILARRAG